MTGGDAELAFDGPQTAGASGCPKPLSTRSREYSPFGAMVDRETFDRIKRQHGAYASWAVWAESSGKPKSNIGDLSVLDPDRNSTLLQKLRNDVVLVALNLSRFSPVPLGNFHDRSPQAQDYKIRYAFADTPYYGGYMTDLIKDTVTLRAQDLMRQLSRNGSVVKENIGRLIEELDDLNCISPTIIAFGRDAHVLAVRHLPPSRYSRLVRVRHYSDYMSQERYRERVLAELAS